MYTASTNLISGAQEKDRGGKIETTSKKFIAALKLSGFVGLSLGSTLLAFSSPLLKIIIGNNDIDPEVFLAALKYVRIRAIGMPAAAIIGTSQAACLGMQDIKSPLYVLLAAAIVNFLGDVCFVGSPNRLIGGTAGAALATVASQYAAVAFFTRWLCKDAATDHDKDKDLKNPRFFFPITLKKSVKKVSSEKHQTPAAKGFLCGKFRARDFLQFPSREEVSDFVPYIVPVTSTQIGRVSSYVSMSHVISSTLGTTSMAAQQIIISVWNCLYPVGESLSSTAQSFVPPIMEKPMDQKARAKVLLKTLRNFWKTAIIFGSGLFVAVSCIPLLNPIFTSDSVVTSSVNSIVPLLLIIFSTLGIFTSSEGMLLGQKDLSFLGNSYAAFFFIVPYFMLRVKRSALSSGGANMVNLRSVWTVFTCYQIFRTFMWVARALYLQRRIYNGGGKEEQS